MLTLAKNNIFVTIVSANLFNYYNNEPKFLPSNTDYIIWLETCVTQLLLEGAQGVSNFLNLWSLPRAIGPHDILNGLALAWPGYCAPWGWLHPGEMANHSVIMPSVTDKCTLQGGLATARFYIFTDMTAGMDTPVFLLLALKQN